MKGNISLFTYSTRILEKLIQVTSALPAFKNFRWYWGWCRGLPAVIRWCDDECCLPARCPGQLPASAATCTVLWAAHCEAAGWTKQTTAMLLQRKNLVGILFYMNTALRGWNALLQPQELLGAAHPTSATRTSAHQNPPPSCWAAQRSLAVPEQDEHTVSFSFIHL